MNNNIFNTPTVPSGCEKSDILLQCDGTVIEQTVSNGYSSPAGFLFDQAENEWVCVTEGWGEIEFSDRTVRLNKGEHIVIPAHCTHRIKATSSDPQCAWLCVFMKNSERKESL